MRLTTLHGLVALNATLLAGFALVSLSPDARAQERRRGNYLITSGYMKNAPGEAVWIVDEVNEELTAVSWDRNAEQMVGLGYRNLNSDAATLMRGRGN